MPSISNIFQGLLSWHRKLQLIEVAKQLQNSSMKAINGHRRRAKPAENAIKIINYKLRTAIYTQQKKTCDTKKKGENWHCESFSEQQKENRRESSRGEV